MVITKKELIEIEAAVGHNCTAQVRAIERGLLLRIVAIHPDTGKEYNFERCFSFEEMDRIGDERRLLESLKF